MYTIPRGTAVITGASSGIGAVFARRLAARGHDLLLHGRREPLLAALCQELSAKHGIHASYVLAELSQEAGVHTVEERIRAVPDLAVLVNNAGSGSLGNFTEEALDEHAALIHTHVLAAVRFMHAALAGMRTRNAGAIINVSSVAGFMIGPRNAAYCASKAFLTSFTESLHLELHGTGIHLQALCPGFTISDFHARLGYDTSGDFFKKFMTAEEVVDQSLRALERGKVVCVTGAKYRFGLLFIPRFVPRRVFYWLVRVTRDAKWLRHRRKKN
ncbi:MAG: SDR family oxidoreductase [Ignavibacteriae bacterium]|nr:SDR family oxidoreductase [Ignavibacteriota bacterium]